MAFTNDMINLDSGSLKLTITSKCHLSVRLRWAELASWVDGTALHDFADGGFVVADALG
ncbi:hypothetical protein ACOSOMT5_P2884 [Acidiphilium sp. MT5]